jgi:hypothetical protein
MAMFGAAPEYVSTCTKCGYVMRAAGPSTLAFAKTQHEYWEHQRKSKEFASGGYIGKPAPPREERVDYVLIQGIAALDDAFFDGARLSKADHAFLNAGHVVWNQPLR